jgi:MFS family permease
MVGLMAGGWINQELGWRDALMLAGMPGLALALLVAFTISTPAKPAARKRQEDLPLLPSLKLLWNKPTFRQMAFALGVYSMGANAMIVFTPAFLMRTYALSSAGAGASLGLVYGIAGVAGVLAGGFSGDILGRKDPRWRVWIPGIALGVVFPFTLAAWFAPTSTWSVILLAAPKFSNLIYMGPVFVALQLIAPVNMRALASAFLLFFNSFIGQAVGPFMVGYLSDVLEPTLGRMSLRYALCFVVLTQVWAAVHFFLAARTLKADTIN